MIKSISYGINIFAMVTVVVIGILQMETFSLGGVGILVWTISPYLLSIYIVMKTSEMIYIVSILSIFIAIFSVSLLIYTLYIQNDAQSALAFFVIPLYQWGILLLSILMTYFIHKFTK